MVVGKRGALVRDGVELSSALVGEIPYGERVVVAEQGWEMCGGERLRITSPKAGWLSRKVVAPAARGAAAPRRAPTKWRPAPPQTFRRAAPAPSAPESGKGARHSRRELEGLLTPAAFPRFLKLRCGVCDRKATERLEAYSALACKYMLSMVWCEACGLALCERHRSNHDCAADGPDPDSGLDALGDLRAERAAAEREAAALKRRQASAAADLHHVVRAQRKVVATKASLVARWARAQYLKPGADGRSDRIFAAFDRAQRASELLWAEWEHPTRPGIAYDEFERVVEAHAEIEKLTGEQLEGVDLALARRLAVRVRWTAGGEAGDTDVLTDRLPGDGDGPLRDAWLHNVRQLIAQQRGRRLDDVDVQVLSVRDEDDHAANPLAGRRTS